MAMRSERVFSQGGKVAALCVLLFYTGMAILPLYLMIVSSMTSIGTTFDLDDLELIPKEFRFTENLVKYAQRVGYGVTSQGFLVMLRWLVNSVVVSTVPVFSSVFFGCMAGYAMSKIRFPGREVLFWAIISTMTIPYFVTLIPMYELIWNFHWVNTYLALIVPTMAGIGTIFLARQFMQTLPGALLESATMDGCSELGIFWHIVLPMARPLLAVLAIMQFVGAWNSFFWAYLVTSSRSMYTLQMGIVGTIGVDMQYAGELDYAEIMAISLLASIPVILVFLLAQKHFVKGLTIGALKG